MTAFVRPVDLRAEQEELLAVVQRNLPDLSHARRFKWLYHDNPAGPAWAWFVCDGVSGRAVGATALFPRAMWFGDTVQLAGQVGDFAVDATHRSLGPAVLLQRATFGPVEDGKLVLCYDCPPDERGMATFRRLGLEAAFRMSRFVRVLHVDRLVRQRLKIAVLATPVAATANMLLRLWPRPKGRLRGFEIAAHTGRFGEEFSALDVRVGGRLGIRGRRSAEDLNWRFRDNPFGEYTVIAARRQGELVGYAVYQVSGDDASVVDLFGVADPDEMVALLDSAVRFLMPSRVQTVQVVIAPDSALAGVVTRAGFWHRSDGTRVVPYAGRHGDLLRINSVWRFTHADIAA